jgi:outer membrane protein OmpA-like peptidoglycan-associated protein
MVHVRNASTRTLCIAATAVLLAGCSGAKKGAGIGGAIGAATGAVIGHQGGKTGTGAVVGGAVGAAAGAIIGDYMAKQKKELEQVPGATVAQEGDELRVKFESAILFDTDSYAIKPSAKDNLQNMAGVLVKYPDTNLVVVGHTDATGTDDHNRKLSEQRAYAVKDYLVTYGVSSGRLAAQGMGESRPVASNDSADGRQQNRRVEIEIAANDALRAKAEAQAQQQQK